MAAPSFIVGIDLGTTNSALAWANVSDGSDPEVHEFAISQLIRAGQVSERSLLPSCLYLPADHEFPAGATQLPWGDSSRMIVGEFARWQGSSVPGRFVASAKSWLCHSGVDRTAAILPWGSTDSGFKVSPVEASCQILTHLTEAWNHVNPGHKLGAQEVVLTVPASFDEAARALTVTAARKAGLENLILVEEPQAAFHDFAANHRHELQSLLDGVRLILVVDVGGGTTDFSLIQADILEGKLELRRIAVGEHLMLGGDNMDAALARRVEERMTAGGRKLSLSQWHQLLQSSREAKERLLGTDPPSSHPIAVAGGGSRLVGTTLSSELGLQEVREILVQGFFPAIDPRAQKVAKTVGRVALQELGLPYAQDPCITRHLATFLSRHRTAGFTALGLEPVSQELPRPDAILLNGGVFKSAALSDHFIEIISGWWPGQQSIRLLHHGSLEVAVARGAVAHGLARRGLGRRIGGGASHAFFVGLAGTRDSVAPKAICVVPRGQEEGRPVDLSEQSFTLTLGRPVQFPLYSTTSDRSDRAGEIVEISEEFHGLPPIHTLLSSANNRVGTVPVHLRASLTELGTLELWCVSNDGDERWLLEFDLRGSASGGEAAVVESMPPRFPEARLSVERVFGNKQQPSNPKEVRQLFRTLEGILGSRETWALPVLRELWGFLHFSAARRRRSADHERAFFQLLGYTLRPGFGYPLDDWRCEQTFRLFADGVNFHSEIPNWNEFWILWRRVAGGLGAGRQETIWSWIEPHLSRRLASNEPAKSGQKARGIKPEGLDEMVRVVASLEELAPETKVQLGGMILKRLENPETARGPWAWALGRIGARCPIYGSSHKVVAIEQAEAWVRFLMGLDLRAVDGAMLAMVSIARMTGDRSRDLEENLRLEASRKLELAGAHERWVRMLQEVVELEAADRAQSLGDTLPIGLQLR